MSFDTDYAALGLDFESPFAILYKPKATPAECTAPDRRGPKNAGKSIQLKGSRPQMWHGKPIQTEEERKERKRARSVSYRASPAGKATSAAYWARMRQKRAEARPAKPVLTEEQKQALAAERRKNRTEYMRVWKQNKATRMAAKKQRAAELSAMVLRVNKDSGRGSAEQQRAAVDKTRQIVGGSSYFRSM